MNKPNKNLTNQLRCGEVAIIPTDTIYGIVGSALNQATVERIYTLRRRAPNKPMIILISSLADLEKFNIKLDGFTKDFLTKHWPAALSVVLPCSDLKFKYLHRGTQALAFRMPAKEDLLNLLKRVGPLVAPSANFEGEKPAETIAEAQKYFGNKIIYIAGGKLSGEPSTLVEIKNGQIEILRQGTFKI